jgi:uncharacterized surface protein with fasciclin (FAS1) repeats
VFAPTNAALAQLAADSSVTGSSWVLQDATAMLQVTDYHTLPQQVQYSR